MLVNIQNRPEISPQSYATQLVRANAGDATGDATTVSASTTAVNGDWLLELAKILVGNADNQLNQLMQSARDQSNTASVLADLSKQLSKYTDMDHRVDGNDGNNGKTADNDANYRDAQAWDSAIECAIGKLPGGADNPVASQLRKQEFGTDKSANPDPNFENDHSKFIVSAAQMSGCQASLSDIQKSNDSEGSMQTFMVQQAIQNRDQVITLLSGLQQQMNQTLDSQAQKI